MIRFNIVQSAYVWCQPGRTAKGYRQGLNQPRGALALMAQEAVCVGRGRKAGVPRLFLARPAQGLAKPGEPFFERFSKARL